MMRVLTLSGSAYQQGWQHGQQVRDLLPQLRTAMQVRLSALPGNRAHLRLILAEVEQVWSQHAPSTLAMLRGIAAALDIEWEEYFAYTVGSYLADRLKNAAPDEGCTVWAAAGGATRDGFPMLAKNRDFRPSHQSLQCFARVQPEHGYAYLYLTSAGSPGVYSSGINAAGLAVADTYVFSIDTGPGIARYSLMMELLERFTCVDQATAYISSVPHFGDGTVTVADASGDMAVFELAHTIQAIRRASEGFVVSTNHFVEPETSGRWKDNDPARLRGNSQARRQVVETALRQSSGQIDLTHCQALMATHGNELNSICRHPEMEPQAVTLAATIYLPAESAVFICNGFPCQNSFERYQVE